MVQHMKYQDLFFGKLYNDVCGVATICDTNSVADDLLYCGVDFDDVLSADAYV